MELAQNYLVVFDLKEPKAEHAKLLTDLETYSIKRPFRLFVSSNRLGYLIRTPLLPTKMTFDQHLMAGDSVLFLELAGRPSVQGYMLKDAAEWIRHS